MMKCTLCGKPGNKHTLGLNHWPADWKNQGWLTHDQRKRYGPICSSCTAMVNRLWERHRKEEADRQRRLEHIAKIATEKLQKTGYEVVVTPLMAKAIDDARREEYYERRGKVASR